MKDELFNVQMLDDGNCYWMKSSDPNHPCHEWEDGEVYCLFDKDEGWGRIIFRVLRLERVVIVHSCYELKKRIRTEADIEQHLLELGFILRSGGLVEATGKEPVALGKINCHFNYEVPKKFKVDTVGHIAETLDFHLDTSLLEKYKAEYGALLMPFLKAVTSKRDHGFPSYAPFVNTGIQQKLYDIRKYVIKKERLTEYERLNLQLRVDTLLQNSFDFLSNQRYMELGREQQSMVDRFIENPTGLFDMMPTAADLKSVLGVGHQDLRLIMEQKQNKQLKDFILDAWLNRAARLLVQYPERSIESIALELGWSSAGAFTRFFKRKKLVTPTAFRKGCKK